MLSTSNGQWIIALTIICQVVVSGTCSIHSVLPSVGIPPFPGKRCTVQCTSWQPFHCTVHSQMAVREGAWNDPLHLVGSSTTVLGVVALGCLPQRKHQYVHGGERQRSATWTTSWVYWQAMRKVTVMLWLSQCLSLFSSGMPYAVLLRLRT